MSKIVMAAVIAAAALIAAPAAFAAEPVVSVKVATADLNLATDVGNQQLLRRINAAAHNICGVEPDSRQIAYHRLYQQCVSGVVDRTVAESGNNRLMALHTGKPQPAELARR